MGISLGKKKTESVLKDPEKLEKLSQTGYEGTKTKFNIHNHAAEIVELYETLKK